MRTPLLRSQWFVGWLLTVALLACGSADAADIVTRYGYNDAGQVTFEAVEADGQRLTEKWTEYDSYGRAWRTRELAAPGVPGGLGVAEDANDRICETCWDVDGYVVRERRKYGTGWAATMYEYDGLKRPVAMVDAAGGRRVCTPDGLGNPLETIDPVGNRTVFAYDAAGNAVLEKRYEGGTSLALQINRRFDSRGHRIVEIEGDGQAGETFQQALPSALTQQRWAYDAWDRLARQMQMAAPASVPPVPFPADLGADPSVDRVTGYTYVADTKRPTTVMTYGGDGGAEQATHLAYDTMGRLVQITDPIGNTRALTYLQVTDPPSPGQGQAASKTIATAGLADQVITYGYDGFDRRASETDAEIVTRYAYDALGRRTQVTSPDGVVTRYELNAFGEQIRIVEDVGGLARTTEMEYDQLGRLVTQIAYDSDGPAQQTTYAYDLMDRRTSITFPDSSSYTYVYDAAGRMTSRTDPRGHVTTYHNNWRGQPLTKTVDGVLKESFSYYPTGWMQAAWMDTATEAAATNKSVFTCDAFGQTRTVTQTVDGVTKVITSDFYSSGDRKRLTYPADVDAALAYTYDDLGQTTQITRQTGTGAAVTLASYTYTGGHLTSRDITTASATETHIRYEVGLDAHRRPVRLANKTVVGTTTTLLDQTDYTFDGSGNRTSARVTAGDQRLTQTAGDGQQNDGYGYDPLNRLIAAIYPAGQGSESFCYDLLGNRVAAGLQGEPGYIDRAGRVSTYSHNAVNEYTSITVAGQTAGPVHDEAGNLTSTESGYGLAYDYENRLVKVYEDANRNGTCDAGETVLADYTYDALGHRVKQVKDSQTTRYYYDSETVLAEYDGSGNLLRYHVHGPTYIDEHVLLHETGQGGEPGQGGGQPQEYYYLLTHLYSVSGLANASGAAVERYRYDVYGTPTWLGFGNFNGDDKVDLRDFLVFQQAYSGDLPCTDAGRICDYDGDGKVNLADYRGFDIGRRGTASTSTGGSAGSPGLTAGLSPFRFTGQPLDFHRTDAATGRPTLVLYHYRARAYDAYHGRFCQRDPAEYEDGLNLYEYVKSQPLIACDPTGRFFDLMDLSASFALSMYLEGNNIEIGMGVVRAIRGFVGLVSARNQMLTDLTGIAASNPDTKAIDTVIVLHEMWQYGQMAMLGAGMLKAGAQFALQGPAAVMRAGAKGLAKEAVHEHHLFPVKFADRFARMGINIDQFTMPLPASLHNLKPFGVHAGKYADSWNGRWEAFFKRFEKTGTEPTAQDALDHLTDLCLDFWQVLQR